MLLLPSTANFYSHTTADKNRRYPCQCARGVTGQYRYDGNLVHDVIDETTDFLYATGMENDKQWFGFCNDNKIGDACHLIEGEVNGKLNLDHQNNTFGLCPLRNLGVRNGILDTWLWYWWVAGIGVLLFS